MCGDAGIRPAEDGVIAVETVEGRAAGARPPLVAGKIILVAEVGAAGTLHDVATHRRHVPKLPGCREQQCLRDDGKAPAYVRMRCDIAHPSQRADTQSSVWPRLDLRHLRQRVDV